MGRAYPGQFQLPDAPAALQIEQLFLLNVPEPLIGFILEPAEPTGQLPLVEIAARQGLALLGDVELDKVRHPLGALVGEERLVARVGAQVGGDLLFGGVRGRGRWSGFGSGAVGGTGGVRSGGGHIGEAS